MRRPILYIAILGLLLLTACSFIASADESADSSESTAQPSYEVTMETEIVEYEEYHITIHYPQTSNNKINQTIIDYVNQRKAAFKKESYQSIQEHGKAKSHELHIDFEVPHQGSSFFVVRFEETMDVGEPELIHDQTVMNFGKKNGKLIQLDQLFKNDRDYVEHLTKLTKEKLRDDLSEEAYYHTEVQEVLKAVSTNYENIALTGNGLEIYLNHAVATLPEKVVISQRSIKDLLNDSYSEALMSEGIKQVSHKQHVDSSQETKKIEKSEEESNSESKRIALTFDDGPHPKVTPNVLKILEKYEAKATFFMIGKRVQYFSETAKMVADQGHEIGNHTWDHPRLTRLSAEEVDNQIDRTQEIIKEVTGVQPRMIRLPFGEVPSQFSSTQLKIIPLDAHGENWQEKEPEQLAQELIENVESGDTLLLHDLQSTSVEVLELVLHELNNKGYKIVKVSEL
ncbi:polysaccharide deacetylase family protein [Halobacillus mangrovi]|uniref:polysaccharide deacetylase family protein n=1 Tax=Halobacillus mangrovi TaxID=402384 RepID=UPI003D954F25